MLATATVFGVATIAAVGCGWDFYSEHTVRFYGSGADSAFRRLPSFPILRRIRQTMFSWDDDIEDESVSEGKGESEEERIERLWKEAGDSELSEHVVRERELLKQYLQATRGLREGQSPCPKDVQKRRNSAFDKLDAITALDHGTTSRAVCDYLVARSAYDDGKPPDEVSRLLAPCRANKNLKDNAAYLEAAVFYRDRKAIGETSFDAVARAYPKSEKRESALYVSARMSMEGRKDAEDGALNERDPRGARIGFQRVIREYPRGRYYTDAKGMLARIYLLAGDVPRALADYYRMLASDDEDSRDEAASSLRFARRDADEQEMDELERMSVGRWNSTWRSTTGTMLPISSMS